MIFKYWNILKDTRKRVLVGLRCSGAPFRRNPNLDRKLSNFTVHPLDRHRKRVDMWTFLLGYVRVGHRKMGDQKASPCGHKNSQGFARKGE